MSFELSLDKGKARKAMPDKPRALSLFKSAIQAIETAKKIPFGILQNQSFGNFMGG
jgi:hypothetical protein